MSADPRTPTSDPPLTHGRHCPCSACAREDWTDPNLAPCGMHGPSCPAVYAPVRTPTSDPVAEPQTEAGRRLLLDIERVVWAPVPGAHEAWVADILAIEAEARQQARAAFAAQVAAHINDLYDAILTTATSQVDADTGKVSRVDPVEVKDAALGAVILARIALLALLAASPEPSPEAPGSGLREVVEFVADWAHDCSPSNRATPWERQHGDEIDPRAYGFDDIEERCRAALRAARPDGAE